MRCAECLHWQTVPTSGSGRGDAEMERMGYRNCRSSSERGVVVASTFLHGSTTCHKSSSSLSTIREQTALS